MFQCIHSTPTVGNKKIQTTKDERGNVWKNKNKKILRRSRVDETETDVSIIIQFSLPEIIKTNEKENRN